MSCSPCKRRHFKKFSCFFTLWQKAHSSPAVSPPNLRPLPRANLPYRILFPPPLPVRNRYPVLAAASRRAGRPSFCAAVSARRRRDAVARGNWCCWGQKPCQRSLAAIAEGAHCSVWARNPGTINHALYGSPASPIRHYRSRRQLLVYILFKMILRNLDPCENAPFLSYQ